MEYRLLTRADELAVCEDIERAVWGVSDLEVLPRSHLVASAHAGGMVLAALDAGEAVGFAYGFPAHHPGWEEPLGFHSHMLAVLPLYRGRGIGRCLKWLQRTWCLERGLPWMTWTFDPLQAPNAKLNLEHLGAVAREYRVNEYGTLGGSLNADLPTDRLVAFWKLDGERARRLAHGEALERLADLEAVPLVLEWGEAGQPILEAVGEGQARLSVAAPAHLITLLQENPALALEWRKALREALHGRLSEGFTITRFIAGSYLLERDFTD